ncbi:dipeptidase [Phenylobacterium sp.]|uniref:dipeptidase n=1 Tax=Phenylobacterium sp. TaxID=1871053 RepID=UPI002736A6A5|nr:dipeptidase [Phenylobacterium sp.]MDP3852119.1 dipeptidase [Phenylobacterium sp.]
MFKFGLPLAVLLASAAPALAAPAASSGVSPAVKVLHENLIVLDTHFDTPANAAVPGFDIRARHEVSDGSQVDYPRMVEGGVDGGFFVIFTPQGARGPAANAANRDLALQRALVIHKLVARNSDLFALATKAEDAETISKAGKRFAYISIENSAPLAGDLTLMKTFYDMGVRMMGPIHFANNDLGDSATDPKGPEFGGLSPLGKSFVAEANRLGVLLDASHSSDLVLDQMLALSKAPIILSHTGAKAIYNHPRNIDDDRLRALAAKGGVIQINAFTGYMMDVPKIPERDAALLELTKAYGSPRDVPADRREAYKAARAAIDAKYPLPRATLNDLMKHILHAAKVAGKDHIGISGDFDGGGGIEGFDDVSDFPALTERLVKAGFTKEDLAKFWGGNALRVLQEADRLKGS